MIIDGKEIAQQLKGSFKATIQTLKNKGVIPCLAVIFVGRDHASEIYVRNKEQACQELGIRSQIYHLSENISQIELLSLIAELNRQTTVNGILVQLPLPKHLNVDEIMFSIAPDKDVDGFHPVNMGKLMMGNSPLSPCTPAGIMHLLDKAEIDLEGKHCVVVGRSNIVGKPAAMMLLQRDATVSICHSKTRSLQEYTKSADVIVSAVGKSKFITASMVKPGAVVIDVGMNRDENGKLCGDVDFNEICEVCSAITPVPGGVGPMTIAMLMGNTIKAAVMQNFGENGLDSLNGIW